MGVLPRAGAMPSANGLRDRCAAVELMGKFDGFSGVAAVAGQGRQRDGLCAQSDGVIGIDHALIVQGQAAGEIEAAWQAAKVRVGIGGGMGEAAVVIGAELLQHEHWPQPKWQRGRDEVR